ncbi:MAG: hypothetical protein Q4A01_11580 [Coriobacteriales bacterium]|nr:hypothetical protein [Coriobacteriales bacterium]
MQAQRRRHGWLMLVALACTVASVAVSWLLAPPTFGMNDDAKMQLILSGGGWSDPSGHAVFINYVLGKLVATLFVLAPTVPWWFVWQVACIAASLYVWNLCVAYAFCGSEGPPRRGRVCVSIAMCLLSSVCVYMYALTLVSFTLTAGAMASCAVMLQCVRMARPALAARHRYGVYEALLVVGAYCTRSSSAMAALPFAALLFVAPLADVIREKDDRRARALDLARAMVPLVAGVALVLCCSVVHSVQYGTPEWKQFLSANAARHKYMDYPHDSYEENPQLYQSVGWSDELETLVNDEWLFMDERVTSEAFLTLSKEGAQTEQLGLRDIYDSWRFGEGMFDSRTVTALVVLSALCVVLLAMLLRGRRWWPQLLMVVAGVAVCMVELYYLEMRGRLVTRVGLVSVWPTLAFLLGLTLTCGLQAARDLAGRDLDPTRPRRMVLRAVGAAVLVLAAARFALAAYRTDAEWKLTYALLLVLCAGLVVALGVRRRAWLAYVVPGLLIPLLFVGCLLAKRDIRGTLYTIDEYNDAADKGISYIAEHPDLQVFSMVSLFAPYDPQVTQLPPNMVYVGGWEFYTPAYQARVAAIRGEDRHNYDILLRDDVRVLCLTDEQADQLCACMEQVLGKDVSWERAGHPPYGVLCQFRAGE